MPTRTRQQFKEALASIYIPLELQYRIIELSIPFPQFRKVPSEDPLPSSRTTTLLAFSLVSRAWSTFSQTLLLRDVVLSTSKDVAKFRDTLEQYPRFGPLVRSLRTGDVGMQQVEDGDVHDWVCVDSAVLQLCTGLEEFRAAKCKVDIRGVNLLKSLKKFYISASLLFDSNPQPVQFRLSLPNLIQLYLVDIAITTPVLRTLESTSTCFLPSLTSVACAFNYPSGEHQNPRAVRDVPNLSVPNLRGWSTSGQIPLRIKALPLECLDCWTDELGKKGLENLPAGSMRILRLNPLPSQSAEEAGTFLSGFVREFGEVQKEFKRLKIIMVIMTDGDDYENAVKKLEEAGKKWKVEVRREIRDGTGENAFFDEGFWAMVSELD